MHTVPISTLILVLNAMENAQREMTKNGLYNEAVKLSNPIVHLMFHVSATLAAVPALEVTT